MKKKHWLAAVIIVCTLALAFFWGGDNHKRHTESEQEISRTSAVKDTAEASQTAEKQQQQERKGYTGTEKNEAGAASYTEAKAVKEISPEKADGINKTEKTPEEAKIEKKSSKKDNESAAVKAAKSKADESEAAVKKDKYLTDPVPAGKPKPVEWQKTAVNKKEKLTCTLSVTCKTILDNMDIFNRDKLEVLPEDGIIYKAREVSFYEGESVFDVLLREMKNNKIHMEFEMTPIYNSNYIEGIHNLYEFDCGELSGWMYRVNGWFPNYGCSRYRLKNGDTVEWIYTCDLGRDIGGGTAAGGKGG